MKIGVDGSCWANKRGYGRYARELLRAVFALDRQNEYVLFLDADTAYRGEDLPERPQRVIVDTTRAATQAASADGHRSLRDLWAMQTAVHRRRRELDLFYFPAEYTFFPLRDRLRTIVTIHDTTGWQYPGLVFPTWRAHILWKLKVRWAIRQAALIFTVSHAARRDVIRTFGLHEEDVWVVSNAPNPVFRPIGDRGSARGVMAGYGIPSDCRIILYVGGLTPHKNVTTLVDAYARLLRERGLKDVRLVLVGDFRGDVFYSGYPALQKQIETLGLSEEVVFTGFVSDADLVNFYNVAHVLVMPSFNEGFGLPAVEAMACGTPILASGAGALPEVVGEAGLFFNPRDPGELANGLQALLENASLQAALGRAALRQAQHYSWEQSARAALAAFSKLADPHVSAPA